MLWKGPAGWELGLGALAVSKALVPWVGAHGQGLCQSPPGAPSGLVLGHPKPLVLL